MNENISLTPDPAQKRNGQGLTYAQYMAEVDMYLLRALSITHRDLADYRTMDAFLDNMPPRELAYEIATNDDIGAMYPELCERIFEVSI